jgi:hypothetical protein
VSEYALRDPTLYERSEGRDSEAMTHEGSTGDTGLTGDLFGTSMRTVSVRLVIVPPLLEGLPTASSQTVPLDAAYSDSLTSRDSGTLELSVPAS